MGDGALPRIAHQAQAAAVPLGDGARHRQAEAAAVGIGAGVQALERFAEFACLRRIETDALVADAQVQAFGRAIAIHADRDGLAGARIRPGVVQQLLQRGAQQALVAVRVQGGCDVDRRFALGRCFAQLIQQRFRKAHARLEFGRLPPLDASRFTPPRKPSPQAELF